MAERTLSIRTVLAAIIALTTALALIVSVALVVMTSFMHRTSEALQAAVESVRLAQEQQGDLLLLERTDDKVLQRDLESRLQRRLLEMRQYVTSAHEARVLRESQARLDTQLAASRRRGQTADEAATRLEQTYAAFEELIAINLDQSRAARAAATRLDRASSALGLAVGVTVLALSGLLLWWLRSGAFRPVLGLADAMERFGRGDRAARAAIAGPRELREMAARFNEMAGSLATDRDKQIAFLAGVAHDLKNPIVSVRMTLARLGPDRPLPPEPRLRRLIELISGQIANIDRMIRDFLDVARIGANRLDLRFEERDVRGLVHRVAELFEAAAPSHRIELSLPDHELLVRCDPLRIEQVVTNLVSNAIKYSPGRDAVEISLGCERGRAVLRVRDHGIGISAEDQRRLFEPFRRSGLSQEGIPGVGLGLYVVREIVEAHGGRIEVESAPGRGSTFTVTLDLAPGLECGDEASPDLALQASS